MQIICCLELNSKWNGVIIEYDKPCFFLFTITVISQKKARILSMNKKEFEFKKNLNCDATNDTSEDSEDIILGDFERERKPVIVEEEEEEWERE